MLKSEILHISKDYVEKLYILGFIFLMNLKSLLLKFMLFLHTFLVTVLLSFR